jgi:hypothetical protein
VSRLSRFQDYRYVGTRDTMRVYDCDDESQFEEVQRRVVEEDLVGRNLMQAFAPDTVDEARNRGFRPVL